MDSLNIPFICLSFLLTITAIYYTGCISSSVALLQQTIIHVSCVTFLINILFSTMHLGIFYITFELLMIPLFFLIGLGSRLRRLRAVTLFAMYTTIFSYIMLFGLIYT